MVTHGTSSVRALDDEARLEALEPAGRRRDRAGGSAVQVPWASRGSSALF